MSRYNRDEYGMQRSQAVSPVIIPKAAALPQRPIWKRQPRTCLAVTLAFILLSMIVVGYSLNPF